MTPKKDAFNVLYGTIPLLWANAEGSWRKNREVFLRTYRNTCKLHEQLAPEELLTHEFVTPDRAVQRTTFASGTEVVVNFGDKPQQVTVKGEKLLLPQNGFAVRGPKVKQSLALVDGKAVTTIQTPGYSYSEAGGQAVTMQAAGPERLLIAAQPQRAELLLQPRDLARAFEEKTAVAYALGAEGQRLRAVDFRVGRGGLTLLPTSGQTELLWGAASRHPDLAVGSGGLRLPATAIQRGTPLVVSLGVDNLGLAPVKGTVSVFADEVAADSRLISQPIALGPKSQQSLKLTVPTGRLDGRRQLVVVVQSAEAELCEANNQAVESVEITADLALWPHRMDLVVETGELPRTDEPVVVPLDLASTLQRLGAAGPPDVAAIRVATCDAAGNLGAFMPAQFDLAPDFDATRNPKGELCCLLPGTTPAGTTRHLALLLRTGKPVLLPQHQSWWRPMTQSVEAPGYVAQFSDGVLTSLAPKVEGKLGPDFLQSLILSSQDTGWGQEENSTVTRFEVLHTGPVRTVIRVEKELKAGVTYEKTYTFYPNRIDVEINVNKPAGGLYSRAHYKLPGTFVDNAGVTAKVNGADETGTENRNTYGKTKDPRWYAVLGDGWAQSCIALSKFDHIAYWDGGQMGAIGFVGGEYKNVRMRYVIHGPQKDASFAEEDWKRVTNPVKVRVLAD